jgi:hypothetical protein
MERIRMKNEHWHVDDVSVVRQMIGEGSYAQALALLRSIVAPAQDFSVQAKAARLVSKIPVSALGKPVRVALLGSSTLDQFSDLLKVQGFSTALSHEGASYLDLQFSLGEDDFYDSVHPKPAAAIKLSRLIGEASMGRESLR